jgi:hypothetical protein
LLKAESETFLCVESRSVRVVFDALPLQAVIPDLGLIQKRASAHNRYKGTATNMVNGGGENTAML